MGVKSLDLVQQICRSASWPEPSTIEGTSDLKTKKVLQAVNYIGIVLGRYIFWRWLLKEGHIRTVAEYTTGDADCTLGSATVTSDNSSTAWTADMKGRVFKANAFEEAYRIKSVTPPNRLDLEELYNGTTTADLSYVIAQDTYSLPEDFDGELNFLQFTTPASLEIINPLDMDQVRFGPWAGNLLGTRDPIVTNQPRRCTIRGTGSDGRLQLQLDPFPDDAQQIRFTYYASLEKFEGDEDTWPFPVYMESVLHDGALSYIRTNAQDDERGTFDLQRFLNTRNELAGLQRTTDIFARFQPDTGKRRFRRVRRRITPGRYDLGTEFDRVY